MVTRTAVLVQIFRMATHQPSCWGHHRASPHESDLVKICPNDGKQVIGRWCRVLRRVRKKQVCEAGEVERVAVYNFDRHRRLGAHGRLVI